MDLELVSEAAWEIWHEDTFDCDCPRQVEFAGRGLVNGLVELWARHLFETVRPDGRRGFSRFNLWWKQPKRSLEIVGQREGLIQLRRWVFGGGQHAGPGRAQAGDRDLLREVAAAHCKLALANQTSEAILAAAAAAANREDFETQLSRLAEDD